MAEPKYHFTTEVPEEAFRRALKATCLKWESIETFLMACMLISIGIIEIPLLSTDYVIVLSIVVGIIVMARAVWMPLHYIRNNLQQRKMMYGKDIVCEELSFYDGEIVVYQPDLEKTLHIPYDYVKKLYIYEDMIIYKLDQHVGQIMKRNIPEEAEFIPWLMSMCSSAGIKNRAK